MINKEKLQWLIKATLDTYNLYSEEAFYLIYGTIIQESRRGKYRRQLVSNFDIHKHALGICQIEQNTFNWLKKVFLSRFPEISKIQFIDLAFNDKASILFCRLRYLVDPKPIPKTLEGQARYWKRIYNTEKGKGTVQQYMDNYIRYS